MSRKETLVFAKINLVMRQGYHATTVDDICAEAQVTKGAFFHHFKSKSEIGLAAMDRWSTMWGGIMAGAGFDQIDDPVDRVFHLLVVMENAYLSPEVEAGCLVGTIAQEISGSDRRLGDSAEIHLNDWKTLTTEILAAAEPQAVTRFEPESLAEFMMAIVQGTLLIAKSRQSRDQISNNISHLRAYISALFGRTAEGNLS